MLSTASRLMYCITLKTTDNVQYIEVIVQASLLHYRILLSWNFIEMPTTIIYDVNTLT